MKDFSLFEKKFNLNFHNKDLLVQAFVHRSYLNENPGFHLPNNERLEFLGDAVLELVVTAELCKRYPEESEGKLTTLRAALVNTNELSKVAESIGFDDFLLLSHGERRGVEKSHRYILGSAFEAFIGSLYLDQGYEKCFSFIRRYLMKELPRIIEKGLLKDAKSRFQEKSQESLGITPAYKVLKEWGPDHFKHFIVGVFLGEEMVAKGEGLSKQEAQEKAAEAALEVKKW